MTACLKQLVFFEPNRVWRCYTGGLLLDRFAGNASPKDAQLPEEWLASTTAAINGPNQRHPAEGLSRIRNPDGSPGPLFSDLLDAHRAELLGPDVPPAQPGIGVLCKFLDAAIRLPIQCHPDRAFAREHLQSEHGKEESWFVLDVRTVRGQAPYLLMGFKPGVSAESFGRAVREQDVAAMASMLHRFEAQPGDAYIIPGRFPHAIGSGVFLLEVQEPTDYVVQPERKIGETILDDAMMWGPLSPATGLTCFDYAGAGEAQQIMARVRLRPSVLTKWRGGRLERLVGREASRNFRVDCLTLGGAHRFTPDAPYHIGIVAQGAGMIEANGLVSPIGRGQAYLSPYRVRDLHITASEAPLQIFLVSVAQANGEGKNEQR